MKLVLTESEKAKMLSQVRRFINNGNREFTVTDSSGYSIVGKMDKDSENLTLIQKHEIMSAVEGYLFTDTYDFGVCEGGMSVLAGLLVDCEAEEEDDADSLDATPAPAEKPWCVTQMNCCTYSGAANVETETFASREEATNRFNHFRDEDLKSNRYTRNSEDGTFRDENGFAVDMVEELKDSLTDEICYRRQSDDYTMYQIDMKRVKNAGERQE